MKAAPGMTGHWHALAAGVRKAPRHEIAVGSAARRYGELSAAREFEAV